MNTELPMSRAFAAAEGLSGFRSPPWEAYPGLERGDQTNRRLWDTPPWRNGTEPMSLTRARPGQGPGRLVEVHRKKPARIVGQQRVNSRHDSPGKLLMGDISIQRHE